MDDASSPAAESPPPTDDVQVGMAEAPPAPISRLALGAFILSFLGVLIAMQGRWYVELVPIAFGILALLTIRSNGKRGRILAIFGIMVATGFGSCAWFIHSSGTKAFAAVPQSLLTILADKSAGPEAQDARLAPWAWPEAAEENVALTESWRAGYAAIEAEFGAWTGEVEFGEAYPGFWVLVMPPKHGTEIVVPSVSVAPPAAEVEGPAPDTPKPAVDGDEDPTHDPSKDPANGGGIWVKALFAQGTVWVCAVLGTGQEDYREGLVKSKRDGISPMVSGLRYFRLADESSK